MVTAPRRPHRKPSAPRPAGRATPCTRPACPEPLERRLLLTAVVVNTGADVAHAPGSAVVSLRDAVAIANKSATATSITFDPGAFATARTITLSGTALEFSAKQPVTLTGPAAGVTVNGNNASADFVVDKGATVTFSRLTVTGGNDQLSAGAGGVANYGALTLANVGVSGNVGSEFTTGGVFNAGNLTLSNCAVSSNFGGGITNGPAGVLKATDVTVSGNDSDSSAGVFNLGFAALKRVTVSGNTAAGTAGPGGNAAGSNGGIGNAGTMSLINCTVAGNGSGEAAGGIGNAGTLTLANCTVSGNFVVSTLEGGNGEKAPSPADGGGLYVDPSRAKLTSVRNSIIAGNSADGAGPDAFGAVQSSGFNLVGKTDASTGWVSTDRTGTAAHPLDALLSPLDFFGGLTPTLVPEAGSPAIDHGSNALIPTGVVTDQRGLPRVANGTVDVGAVEVQPSQARIAAAARAGLAATEGLAAALSPGSFTATGAAGPFAVLVHWGDGTADDLAHVAGPGALPALSHTFAEEGAYRGAVTVFDATGHNSAPVPFTVSVADAPLNGSAAARTGVATGVPFAWQVATFTDADPGATASDFSATIDWGDGTASPGLVSDEFDFEGPGTPYAVTGVHAYAKAGTYPFVVTVRDAGGAVLTRASTITVTDARAIVVNTTADRTDAPGSATVSLRDAVSRAGQSTVPTTIVFDPTVFATARTITLGGSELELGGTDSPTSKTTISIVGPSAGVTVNGNGLSRVFQIDSTVSAAFARLTVTGGGTTFGAGILNGGALFMADASVSANDTDNTGDGGGIYSSGFLAMTDVTVAGNHGLNGAGVQNTGGSMFLANCTVANNTGANGGGIDNGGTAALSDCTVAGNQAQLGGGAYSAGPTLLANTVLAGNSAGQSGPDASGDFQSLGFNLVGKTDGSTGWVSADLTGTVVKPLAPGLSPLGNFGGPTLTMVPTAGSPLIDHGSNALLPPGLVTDQRGQPRVHGPSVDIGAVEKQT